ncbi:VHL beta domain-containing protein [Insolitispirillum peregrinum]|uniref:VHL beta domain-containing protein n=1 Tax=Insolitispirillum peregrinum TaxID=80876 RepID=UPI003613A235
MVLLRTVILLVGLVICGPVWAERSPASSVAVTVEFENPTADPVALLWVDFNGKEVQYATLAAGQRQTLKSYAGHVWHLRSVGDGALLRTYVVDEDQSGPVTVAGETSRPAPTPPPVQQSSSPRRHPPFSGQVFVASGVLTEDDPSALQGLSYSGREERTVFDRRTGRSDRLLMQVFRAEFRDSGPVDVQVNSEFPPSEARAQAEHYARVVGQLPALLRRDLTSLTIHRGNELFGGGSHNILIHTEQGEDYQRRGVLEEAMCHEAAHTSLDSRIYPLPAWRAAQQADPTAISDYAAENPDREDVAESFCLYYGLRFHPERLDVDVRESIEAAIPNRIRVFDGL